MTDVEGSERKVAQDTEAASGERAMIPAVVPVFRSCHDPSTAVGMTAEEKERKGCTTRPYNVSAERKVER